MSNIELLKKWRDALRSGKYKQGTGVLKSALRKDTYCVMGVAAEECFPEHDWKLWPGALPPSEAEQLFGESSRPMYQGKFMGMNDRQEKTFPEFADIIDCIIKQEENVDAE